jgi:hypothetical protein
MKLSLLTVICALALSIPAQADSLNTVTANAVFQGTVGNLVIAPKTFTVFFEWDVTTDSLVPNTLLAEGPFGPLSLSAGFFPTSSHFMNFIDGFGDNLQISFLAPLSSPGGSFDTPGVYGTGISPFSVLLRRVQFPLKIHLAVYCGRAHRAVT